MRIFSTCETAINELVREVFSRGIQTFDSTVQAKQVEEREYGMKELLGYSFMISDTSDRAVMFEFAKKNFNYGEFGPPTEEEAEAWFQERLHGTKEDPKEANPGEAWKYRRAYWEKFGLNSEGRFSYTYTERMRFSSGYESQVSAVILLLKKNRYSRGAVIGIWDPNKDPWLMGNQRIPCSLAYHFMVRPYNGTEKLWVFYHIRSQDLASFLPTDVFCSTRLQDYIGEAIGVPRGPFVEAVDSLHCYRKFTRPERQW